MDKQKQFMLVAIAIGKLSSCKSREVGCVLVDKNNYIIGTGYNGVPRGFKPCETCNRVSGEDLGECPSVHAEQNALMQCHDVMEIETCYVTTQPCSHCIKMLLNTPCKKIYYVDVYPHRTEDLWRASGRAMELIQFI